MTIATRGQGIAVDPPPDGQNNVQQAGTQQLLGLSLQLTPDGVGVGVGGESQPGEGEPPNAPEKEPCTEPFCSCQEPEFPHAKLAMLDEKISSPRWVVPVLPDQELECLMLAAINLCKTGQDVRSEACQRFFREGLTISFTKILTDDAVNSWKHNIQHCILQNCERLVELCVIKLSQDWFPLLDLLAMVFNPNNKFHSFNASRTSETVPPNSTLADEDVYARPSPDSRAPRGWLVDLINKFGSFGGFQILLERFTSGKNLSVPIIHALIRPFGLCHELLTVHTIIKYLMPIVEMVPDILDNLTDDELKKEAKNESKNDAISSIIKSSKSLASRVPNQEETIKSLEIFRLKMILRLLQISSFNGKMNALNEVNKVIASVTYYPHRHSGMEQEEEWLTPERMAKWIKENNVLEIVLRDSLHQPQYVEKLEKILRFIIKEKTLSLEDLDAVWAAQCGKHEAIVKNVHDLLAKLAWDFSPEQLDHLFECFQSSWTNANKKQREKLLELIRRLAEDDKDGVMAHKVLTLFWNLAHSEDVMTDIMDQALAAHIKILDYSCSQERDAQKTEWLNRCVEELKTSETWVLPALKQIREIFCLYEPNPAVNHSQRTHQVFYRQEVIDRLQNQHSLVILVTTSLTSYMDKVRHLVKDKPDLDPDTFFPDKRYNHIAQVQERLNFLRFLLKEGQLWLCKDQARQIWQCLADDAVFVSDREACFKWFSKLMGEEPDLDPSINKEFFENNVLQLDPTLLTESGMKCFERFFKAVNSKEGKLKIKRRAFMMDDPNLIGLEYIWRVVTNTGDDIASRAIELLKEVSTNLGPKLQQKAVEFHQSYISECLDRLNAHYNTVMVLNSSSPADRPPELNKQLYQQKSVTMCRVMKVLQEYISECDNEFSGERKMLPLHRAYRGKHLELVVRFTTPGRQGGDDLEIQTHSNDTIGSVRRQVLRRIKAAGSHVKLDLYSNGDMLDPINDWRLLNQVPVRDKTVLSAKLSQANANMASSPDSSSDSSTSSPQHPYDGPGLEAEYSLPGVLMSQGGVFATFFFQVADLGSEVRDEQLRDSARAILALIPPDLTTVERLQVLFGSETVTVSDPQPTVENMFFCDSPSRVLYNLVVMYTMLMPASDPLSEKAVEFQMNFLRSPDAHVVLDMLTKNNFLPKADVATKRCAYLTVLRICKMLLSALGHIMYRCMEEAPVAPPLRCPVAVLKHALTSVPSANSEHMLRAVACQLADVYTTQVWGEHCGQCPLVDAATRWQVPGSDTIRAVIRLAWSSCAGNLQLMDNDLLNMPIADQPSLEDTLVCEEALEVLTVALVLSPSTLDTLSKDKMCEKFIIDLVLRCNNRSIRVAAAEQFLIMSSLGTSQQFLQLCIPLLFNVLHSYVTEYAHNSHEYFQLLCQLLNFAYHYQCNVNIAEQLLANEINWLKKIRERVKEGGETEVDEAVLEGHLGIARELLNFMTSETKYQLGSDDSSGMNLIKELVEDFIFPASKLMLHLQRTGELMPDPAVAVCSSPQSLNSACELLVSLCVGCVPNMRQLTTMLTDMFYSERDEPLVDWDYLPPVGPRPHKGFVGLKNAGATCYMNSVLQQLYMVESIRAGLLAAEGAATDLQEDFSGDERPDSELLQSHCETEEKSSMEESRKEYNIGILKQVQAIFGHLGYSKLQYYVPRGLWKHFKLQGEPVNLREQQDAVEFFMSLVESLDEALKALSQEQIMGKILGGSYSDQKICKGCPHRYSKEEPFSVISVDIRNHSNLVDSLEQYVKGELLEGADAYHCDKCNKKVVTVKRLCVKKLPPILAIQLKRFEYDFERVCAIKFNDYFEFPRLLDMDPYTVTGLAKQEGEMIDCDYNTKDVCTRYQLSGIVVHSGQASGGHYYSYILHRQGDGTAKWYKFDDGEVTECKMDDDEEMKTQCFGGDYMGEVFDHMLKRMSFRRQKRWWNAYMLFYTRLDVEESTLVKSLNQLSLSDTKLGVMKMPTAIERSVRRQNIRFMHNRNQFSVEYFQFIRKLASCNIPPQSRQHNADKFSAEAEELSMLSVQLVSKFLFHTGFHTKKTLRGNATDWYDTLNYHLRSFKSVRSWFAHNVLFKHPHRFCEYLLSCPSTEVRSAFMKIIVFLAHFSLQDGPCPPPMLNAPTILLDPKATMSDHLLMAVLSLLHKEVSEHGRHLPHYFTLFHTYACLGIAERTQLLRLNVPATFMSVALDEGPGPNIKYQYPELTKLHMVVSLLIRCTDVSSRMQSSQTNTQPLPNPFRDPMCPDYLMPVPPLAAEILFTRSSYVKKVIEDGQLMEDGLKLLQFCCWENPHLSRTCLSELLWQIAYAYCHELRHYIDLLLGMLLMEDSWQTHRIHNALKGMVDERDGLFDIIQRAKNHYQKRAYQCIKCLVTLFSKCSAALQMLNTMQDFRRKWALSVEWLQDELERQRPYVSNSYNTAWSPPAQSNETANGYFLERSNSARKTLELACELVPSDATTSGPGSQPPVVSNHDGEAEETGEEGEGDGESESCPDEQPSSPGVVTVGSGWLESDSSNHQSQITLNSTTLQKRRVVKRWTRGDESLRTRLHKLENVRMENVRTEQEGEEDPMSHKYLRNRKNEGSKKTPAKEQEGGQGTSGSSVSIKEEMEFEKWVWLAESDKRQDGPAPTADQTTTRDEDKGQPDGSGSGQAP